MVVDLPTYIHECAPNVAQSTMMAIVRTESKGNPLAINLNKGHKLKFQPNSINQAKAWVRYLEKNNYNFDVGLAQVNIKNIHKYGYKAEEALDPCINLSLGSKILVKYYSGALQATGNSSTALQRAISAYNTGNYTSGFRNSYVAKVYANAGKPVVLAMRDNIPPISTSGSGDISSLSKSKKEAESTKVRSKTNPYSSKTVLYVRPRMSNTLAYNYE